MGLPIYYQSHCHPIDIHCNLLSMATALAFYQGLGLGQCKYAITHFL